MLKPRTWMAAFALLVLLAGLLPPSTARAFGETICVDPDASVIGCYRSISTAIINAEARDVIEISADTYYENLEIDKELSLHGTSTGSGARTVIRPLLTDRSIVHILPGVRARLVTLEITGAYMNLESATAVRGAPIYNEGRLYAHDLIVHHNYNGYGIGGGIFSTDFLKMTDSSVHHNSTGGFGGGIASHSLSTVILIGTDVSDNHAGFAGGGIWLASGRLELTESTVHHNITQLSGGGIWVGYDNRVIYGGSGPHTHAGPSQVYLERVTIDQNYANSDETGDQDSGSGAGLTAYGAEVTLENVTLSGNVAATRGGAIKFGSLQYGAGSGGNLSIYASTIANNISLSGIGGGIASGHREDFSHFTATISHSVLADNYGGNCNTLEPAVIESRDYNVSDDATCDMPWHADLINADPMLNPLALNAPGSVRTHALQIGSPAIDRDEATCGVAYDARGVARDGRCDAGAYEGSEEPRSWHGDISATVLRQAVCRFGPSTAYRAVAYLTAGEMHEVIGRTEDGTWLRLENCWVYTPLLQVEGEVDSISVAVAPPLPTPRPTEQPSRSGGPACRSDLDPTACAAAGGTYEPGMLPVCRCP